MLVMLATSATAEGSFSAILRQKNYFRSAIGQERLNSVVLISLHDKYANEINLCDVGM
jgi:hypothetical protein